MNMETDNGKKKTNAPPLRFPGFRGEWEECKVSDLLSFYSTNSLCWEQLEYGLDNIKNLHYGLIHVGLPTLVDLSKEALPSIKDNVPINFELCKEGDVAFADASEDTNEVCKAVEFYKLCNQRVVCGLHTIHGRDNTGKTVIGFKGYAFSSSAFHNQIRRIAQGTKIYSINVKNFSECHIGIPSKAEQRKIAGFLRLLDERIAAQRALIGEMGRLIGGIREWLFAHQLNCQTVRLADICEIVKGQQINKNELSETGPYYVMNGGTSPSGYYSKCNTDAGVISISEGGSCGYVQWNESPFWSGGHCYTLQNISDCVDHLFLYQYLKHNESRIQRLRIGSSLQNIQKKTLESFTVKLPSFTEQTKISTALKAVDLRAKNAEELLRLLLKQKSFFLQKLFI